MRLSFTPGTTSISVNIQLGAAVAIDEPEVWRFNGAAFTKENRTSLTAGGADWSRIARGGATQDLYLELYWSAFDPQHDHWLYDVTISVRDQTGALLPGREGHPNPTVLHRSVGEEVAGWDHHREPISIIALVAGAGE